MNINPTNIVMNPTTTKAGTCEENNNANIIPTPTKIAPMMIFLSDLCFSYGKQVKNNRA